MWRKLRKQIDVQRQMLRRPLTDHRPLLRKCEVSPPDPIELSALGAMLQSFYTGEENILKRVAVELHEELPRGEGWHNALLQQMTAPGLDRPPLLSGELAQHLARYLHFRHLFRNVYPFQLRWDRMAGEVRDFQFVLSRLEDEITAFLKATEDRQ